jgi:AcrR family transcriptional regulator
MKSAVAEFAAHGYTGASMNAVSSGGGISKGIIYHYFNSKSELYLSCVSYCINDMASSINEKMSDESGDTADSYFDARIDFLGSNPEEAKIFCEAVLDPPEGLSGEIKKLRKPLDDLNIKIFDKITAAHEIRHDLDRDEAVNVFRMLQDSINRSFREDGGALTKERIKAHEKECRDAVSVFLYGIIAR